MYILVTTLLTAVLLISLAHGESYPRARDVGTTIMSHLCDYYSQRAVHVCFDVIVSSQWLALLARFV